MYKNFDYRFDLALLFLRRCSSICFCFSFCVCFCFYFSFRFSFCLSRTFVSAIRHLAHLHLIFDFSFSCGFARDVLLCLVDVEVDSSRIRYSQMYGTIGWSRFPMIIAKTMLCVFCRHFVAAGQIRLAFNSFCIWLCSLLYN